MDNSMKNMRFDTLSIFAKLMVIPILSFHFTRCGLKFKIDRDMIRMTNRGVMEENASEYL